MTATERFDPRLYRNALGKFATGVTVVTTVTNDGEKTGVTVNSFSSVSLHPPLILWCLRVEAKSYPCYEQASHFCINVLATGQAWLSNRFASSSRLDRFDGVVYTLANCGVPVISDTSAYLICEKTNIYHEGDHYIILGEVTEFSFSRRPSLIFYKGEYASPGKRFSGENTFAGHDDYVDFEFA